MALGTKVIGNTTTEIVERKTERSLLVLCNASDETIFLGFDEEAVLNSGIALKPLGPPLVIGHEGNLSALLSNAVNGISASGTKNLAFLQR